MNAEAGYRTILVTDACADRGKERHHAALALYGDYMYELRTVGSLQRELDGRGKFLSVDKTPEKMVKSRSSLSLASTSSTSRTGSLSSLDGEMAHERPVNVSVAVTS